MMRVNLAACSLSLLGLLFAGCAATVLATAAEPDLELFVLGTAQDGGLPHLGCERPCCVSARETGRTLFPACLGIVARPSGQLLLVEATPRVTEQVALLQKLAAVTNRGRRPVDAVLLTHAHIGHYLGLAFFGREVAATQAVPTFCSPRMAEFLRSNGPWRQLVELHQLELRECLPRIAFAPLPGLLVTAIPVPHRDEYSDTMAYRLRGKERTVLFVPDIDAWDRAPDLLTELIAGVDVAYVDATFYDGSEVPERNLAEIRHPLMTDTMQRLALVARARPGMIRFLHLNHSNKALHDKAVIAELERQGFAIAQQGERQVL
ncbi:MAG: MBL fold metallo-hydrolase [Planctomycetota bacterium]|nr:MBL fold metallo-hydrolase [Planctomycetota bacterium]MSR39113.1 MBL fold metallo-hydrolase [Planctomycetota bacterium]